MMFTTLSNCLFPYLCSHTSTFPLDDIRAFFSTPSQCLLLSHFFYFFFFFSFLSLSLSFLSFSISLSYFLNLQNLFLSTPLIFILFFSFFLFLSFLVPCVFSPPPVSFTFHLLKQEQKQSEGKEKRKSGIFHFFGAKLSDLWRNRMEA